MLILHLKNIFSLFMTPFRIFLHFYAFEEKMKTLFGENQH